jgi:hypothetical protein
MGCQASLQRTRKDWDCLVRGHAITEDGCIGLHMYLGIGQRDGIDGNLILASALGEICDEA